MKIIKRYQNRKLYDTDESAYVTLAELRELTKQGIDFQVVCNKTKNDVTGRTLLNIIEINERSLPQQPDVNLLRRVITTGDGTFTSLVGV
jgi:polyhydroxyalkanoate synthesis repressor PhaR